MKMLRWRLLVPTMWCLVPCQGTVKLYSSPVMAPSSRGDAMSPEAVISDFNYDAIASFPALAEVGRAEADSSVELHLPQTNGSITTIRGTVNSIHQIPESPGTYRVSGSAPWDPSQIATFSLYVDTVQKLVMGDLVADDDNWYRFETKGDVRVNRIPRESAICVLSDTPAAGRRQLAANAIASSDAHSGHQHGHHHHHQHEDRQLAQPPQTDPTEALHKVNAVSLPVGTGPGQAGRRLQGGKSFLIFLDVQVTDNAQYGDWTNVNSLVLCAPPSAERMTNIINIVREDYAPFDVTVTSDRPVYSAWTSNRVRVGFISSVGASGVTIGGGTCGAAYVGKYQVHDNLVWVVVCGGPCSASDQLIGQTISHEVGHAFNLQHDGSKDDGAYLRGLPSKPPTSWPNTRRWNTIMGISGTFGITQWSRGEYPGYSSGQGNADDLQLIRDAVGDRSNAYCDQTFPLQTMGDATPYAYSETAISCGGGTHRYMIEFTSAGRIGIEVSTSSETNLKFEVTLFGGTGSVETFVPSELATARGSNNAYDSSAVTLNSAISPGLYLIRIRSVAQTANTAAAGAAFPLYGSVGFYTLRVVGPSDVPGPTSPPDTTPETPAPSVIPGGSACSERVCGCGRMGATARSCRPQLRLSMRLAPGAIKANGTTTLTLTVRNNGRDSVPLVSVNLNLPTTLTLQSADSSVRVQGTSAAITLESTAGIPAASVRSFSVRLQASSTVVVGSGLIIEGSASTYGVSSVPKVRRSVRIRK